MTVVWLATGWNPGHHGDHQRYPMLCGIRVRTGRRSSVRRDCHSRQIARRSPAAKLRLPSAAIAEWSTRCMSGVTTIRGSTRSTAGGIATTHPTAEWTLQQLRKVVTEDGQAPTPDSRSRSDLLDAFR